MLFPSVSTMSWIKRTILVSDTHKQTSFSCENKLAILKVTCTIINKDVTKRWINCLPNGFMIELQTRSS